MPYTIRPLTEAEARETLAWRYDGPYAMYDPAPDAAEETVRFALDPANRVFAIEDEGGHFVGFCSFGEDGQVPGWDYDAEALDLGIGIRPAQTGQGRGAALIMALLDFARAHYRPARFRVTIASWNQRAQRVAARAGFVPVGTFTKPGSEKAFTVMERPA